MLGLALCKLRDFLGLHDTFQKSVDHQPPGESEHVTQNVAELDIGILEDLLDTAYATSYFRPFQPVNPYYRIWLGIPRSCKMGA